MISPPYNLLAALGDKCDPNATHGGLFGFPTWYRYLSGTRDPQNICIPVLDSLSSIWLILAAVIEILLRLSALAAVAIIIYSGILYTISQGEPEKTAKAKSSLVNALIGLAISVMAAFIVSFISRSIK